jgi:1-acyl-sn-glycerol-3-phosphate acyltransferase
MDVSRQPPASAAPRQAENVAEHLLDIVGGLAQELHPRRGRALDARWESRLDRDLGIDSLGRAELLSRIERAFRVRLPQSALAEAETPRDLLAAVQAADTGLAVSSAGSRFHSTAGDPGGFSAAPGAPVSAVAAPTNAATLTAVLDEHARNHPDRPHIVLWDEADREPPISYRALAEDARAVARGLLDRGFEPGARAALMLPTGKSFFQAFFGILYAGGIPVPIYPPARMSQLEDHLRRQVRILDNAAVGALVTVPQARPAAVFLKTQVRSLRWVETAETLRSEGDARAAGGGPRLPAEPAGDSIALLQYTSGSTGDPKGVTLTHANLLANMRAFGERLEIDSSDVCVSWLPLYHDMGLIGTWLGSLYFGGPVVILSPLTFLARPEQWLRAIDRHRGTISAAPNFAYELCLRKIEDRDIEGLDLSCWRNALNGAEPVSAATIRRFSARFARFGFRAESMAPVYGMAESSVALTIPAPGRPPMVDRVDRAAMSRHGHALPAPPQDEAALEFVACGSPLPGHQVRIVDALGREVEERRQGRLQFRGPSSTQGYYRNEAATRPLFDGPWLDSGDLAYIADGDVYLTGRSKDIIIRAGRNLYPHELEEAIGNIEGVRKGCVAVFAAADLAAGTERIVILAETRLTAAAEREWLQRRIERAATDLLESAPDEVVLAPPHTVPKTSSGKVRRSAARQLYETGKLAAGRRALWWQMARLSFSGAVRSVQRAARTAGELLYAAYFWTVLGGTAFAAWPLVVLLPGRRRRFAVFRDAARWFFFCMAIPVHVSGREHLHAGGCILIANHASYLDGLVLAHALPGEFSVVAKKELLANVITRLFLRGLGAIFVERFQTAGSVEDSGKVAQAARAGETVLVFPEGTFTRMPGLLEFRMGAFVSAAQSGLPVVAVTMRGTRSILRDGQWLPGWASVQVEIAPPLYPGGNTFEAALRLRDRARTAILNRCGEPDLAAERTILSSS